MVPVREEHPEADPVFESSPAPSPSPQVEPEPEESELEPDIEPEPSPPRESPQQDISPIKSESEQSEESQESEPDNPDEPYPILFLDVNLGKGRVERLVLYDGDAPETVAEDFCKQYGKSL